MQRPEPRQLEVTGRQYITPNMLRISLGGPGLVGFPDKQESAYVKLMFERKGNQAPLIRTYTVRQQRNHEIDIDFALHEHPGPAGAWALQARVGQRVRVGGPGPRKLVDPAGDWHVLAADMTALPALSVNLEQLPADAKGYAVIEVATEADRQALTAPPGVDIQWVISRDPSAPGEALVDRAMELPWLPGKPSIWCACEFSSMRRLRQFFGTERRVDRKLRYISSYWKYGLSEDQHKISKRQDAENNMQAPPG